MQNESNKLEWNWHPKLPFENNPLFYWPLNFKKIFKWYSSMWLTVSEATILALFSILSWFYLQPSLEICQEFRFGWISQMYLRNLSLIFLVAGSLHLYFYKFGKQNNKLKYNSSELARNNKKFIFGDQVLDNMFWSLVSGVTLWTVYEVLIIWSYANGKVPLMFWDDSPTWFVLLFLLITMWESLHFYVVHRLLHWRPLYRIAHSVHHRNINTGPWSGISMHPIEHLIYFSSVLIHFVIPSHPIHLFFHMYLMTLNPLFGHTDFEGLLIKGKKRLAIGHFDHQLHHRYFDCNYGTSELPLDDWFDSFHNGTPESNIRIKERRRQIHENLG